MPADPRVATAMDACAHSLQGSKDVKQALLILTRCAVDTIDDVHYASITFRHRDGRTETLACTDPLLQQVDALQDELQQGPRWDRETEDLSWVADNVGRHPRWSLYGPKVAALGIGAQMGLKLATDQRWAATLNLYAMKPDAFAGVRDAAEDYASYASVAMRFICSMDTLLGALKSRRVIGQAIGVVMERYAMPEDRAFAFLVRVSQTRNVKLRVIAAEVVATGLEVAETEPWSRHLSGGRD